MASAPRRFLLLAYVLARTAAAAAAARAAPLFLGITIAATVIFSPSGMQARDVTGAAERSLAIRLVLWAAWLLAATPLARALFDAPGTAFLRALPVPRVWLLAVLGAVLLALQAPWALLWGAGAGWAAGLAAAAGGAAGAALFAARPARAVDALALVAPALAVALATPPGVLLAAAAPCAAYGLRAGWIRAPEAAASGARLVRGPAPVALGIAYHARLARGEAALLVRGAFAALAGGALAGVGARSSERLAPGVFSGFTVAVTALFLAFAAGGVAAPVVRAEREIAWLLDTTATPASARVLSSRGVAAAWGATFGAIAGAVAAALAGVGPAASARAVAIQALWGAALAALAAEAVHRAARGRAPPPAGTTRARRGVDRESGALVHVGRDTASAGPSIAVALAALAAGAALGELAPAALALGAALLAWRSVDSGAYPGAPRRQSHAPPGSEAGATMILDVRDVRKLLGGRWVLDRVRFQCPEPGITVVFGENGAGKSTLLRIIAGVVEMDDGEVVVAGHALGRSRERALAQLGYVPDALEYPVQLTVREILALCAALGRAPPPAPDLVDRLGVGPLLGVRFGALSLGQRRRAGLVAALLGDPRLLVLDEPTNGLDADGRRLLEDLLRERAAAGAAALVATHDRALIDALGGRVLVLEAGRVAPAPERP